MRPWDSFESALRAIVANKLRSFLTMLGVVIGVGSVIAMIGIGEGTKKKSIENLEIMGSNLLTVFPNWRRGGMSMGSDAGMTLRDSDVEMLKREVPLIKNITGTVRQGVMAKHGNKTHSTSVFGALPIVKDIRNLNKMLEGGWYTDEDEVFSAQKAVIGYQVWQELYDGNNAVGTNIRLKNQNFEVVGVVDFKGGSGMWNPDDQIYIPLSTAKTRLMGKTNLDMIQIQATHTDLMILTQGQVEDTLMKTRGSAMGEPLFRVMNQGEAIEQIETQTRLLSILLAGIASVSLLVGGIGIMNIMLVSVTERTREIGLRKAIGAKRGSILSQFLLESVVMCLVGGVLGIALGWTSVIAISKALQVPPEVHTPAIITAFGFSAMVGIFFGLYPAMRASRLQPMVALRSE
ncbi:MAG: ABC transporter permease [Fimbriimonadaceae bacterium]|nr:ABC transporter permease [Fimbriimonadaceae bacterium]